MNKLTKFVIEYEPSYEIIKLLITQQPFKFGMFPSTLLFQWMRDGQNAKTINKLIKKFVNELLSNPKYKQPEWKFKISNTMFNLLLIKNNETLNQNSMYSFCSYLIVN